jgi:hypothetical protein
MFKINIKKLAICLLLTQTTIFIFSTSAFAAPEVVNPNKLLFSEQNWPSNIKYPETKDKFVPLELENVNNLPDITLEQGVGNAIKTVLKVTLYLTIISIVVAALYYIISLGKEEDITKARNIILYLVIGMAIISAAYAFTTGLAKFDFFQDSDTTATDTTPAP